MQPSKTVILGEASEESDTEEISLDDSESAPARQMQSTVGKPSEDNHTNDQSRRPPLQATPDAGNHRHPSDSRPGKSSFFGANLFATIGSSSQTLARLVNYAPYNILGSSGGSRSSHQQRSNLTPPDHGKSQSNHRLSASQVKDGQASDGDQQNSLTPLHGSLLTKNRQLHASLNHLYKQPLQVASRSIHSINQRLVNNQKLIREMDNAMVKIQREQRNLDIQIVMIS